MLRTDEIKRRREVLELTQEQAALATDGKIKNRQKWNDVEQGRQPNPTLKVLTAVARALQCSIADLVEQPWRKQRNKAKT